MTFKGNDLRDIMNKKELRKNLQAKLQSMPDKQRSEKDEKIFHRIINLCEDN